MVFLLLSTVIFIFNSSIGTSDWEIDIYLNLSHASDAFDISSLKKTSLFE